MGEPIADANQLQILKTSFSSGFLKHSFVQFKVVHLLQQSKDKLSRIKTELNLWRSLKNNRTNYLPNPSDFIVWCNFFTSWKTLFKHDCILFSAGHKTDPHLWKDSQPSIFGQWILERIGFTSQDVLKNTTLTGNHS